MTDRTTPPPTSTERTDLADLVRDRMAELGIGLRPLAAASIDPENPAGGPLWTRPTLQNFLGDRKRIKAPGPAELRALAAALQLPLRDVQDAAAAQFFGMDALYSPDESVRAMVRNFEALGPEDRQKVIALMERFRNG
ncbi:XRE family transcriptional regulator [Streptomyces sp. HNM0645]|uniref:XRE family transcriptional regulator n=1 Tax=Streptomyces sp. HNM0645 TaxID=2782343 RepID=UPI0024B6D721|nr:XRE family transcriptional regulator [Streptomyces sp. HNM0645]MDI9885879.1 XRE family transcriptional regulator [Streptomyces sp. HNM0645]